MENNKNIRITPQDDKVIKIFTELGMPKNLAKILMYISQVDECRSADVEQGTKLRQPEVSVVMQQLMKKGWVKKRDLRKKGKGRPIHIYKLTYPLGSIIENFEKEKMLEIKKIKNDIAELKNIVKNI
ncbi:MAG: ArsR family transcriptional regulator [Candidatus Thermoplasmatota archaeon]|nr:ArsR family transcriptional regulator [Candidatus Thermoplasmatota archaeon]